MFTAVPEHLLITFKGMKRVRVLKFAFAILVACLAWGCSTYEEVSDSIDNVFENTLQIDYLDSLTQYFQDSAGVECPDYSCRELHAGLALTHSDSMSVFNPLRIHVDLHLADPQVQPIIYQSDWSRFFYLEIYGCKSVSCKEADKVIFRSEDYSYSVLFKSDEFSITERKRSDVVCHEGEVELIHNFNIKIDTKGVHIDWDVQMGDVKYEDWVEHRGGFGW